MKPFLFVAAALVVAPSAFAGDSASKTTPTAQATSTSQTTSASQTTPAARTTQATPATPEGFMAMVPSVPVVTGIASDMARSAFHDKVESVIENMDAVLNHMPAGGGAKKSGFFTKLVPGPLRGAASHAPDPTDALTNTPALKNLAAVKAKFPALDAEYLKSREEVSVSETKSVRKANRMDSKTATKRYAALLKEYQAAIKAALPDFQRQAALSVASAAPGASKVAAVSGPAMREIRQYASLVLNMYKYVVDND